MSRWRQQPHFEAARAAASSIEEDSPVTMHSSDPASVEIAALQRGGFDVDPAPAARRDPAEDPDDVFRAQGHGYPAEAPAAVPDFDLVGSIIAHESGELDARGTLTLFGHLIGTSKAWALQGHYGRMAEALIAAGLIAPNGEVDWGRFDELSDR